MRSEIFWELWSAASPIPGRGCIDRSSIHRCFQRGALRRNDCAPRLRSSHRYPSGASCKTIESLELTIKPAQRSFKDSKTFNNKRNKSVYDVAGAVSDQELEAVVKLATELKDSTLAWLREFHPELLKSQTLRVYHTNRATRR